ncbi:MAG: hypothetical protein ACK5OX_15745 [Desertimonas sp.]
MNQARALGISRAAERTLLERGALASPYPGVLTAGGAPARFESRAMAAVLGPGAMAIAHGAAGRLHRLDGFADHDVVDVIGVNGARAHPAVRARFHQTRGPVRDQVVDVAGIPTLSIALTLTLLAPVVGIGPTARALDDALRRGVDPDTLTAVATSWRQRGRSGPPALLMLLGERAAVRAPIRTVSRGRRRASRRPPTTGRAPR